MPTKDSVRTCGNRVRTYSLVPSDQNILTRQMITGCLLALLFVGIPFVMALMKQWGWY